jgi:tryptophan synthase alpha chain
MSRYAAMFGRLGGDGALGAFLMLGDRDLEASARHHDSLVEGGADMIEVGSPFSDPVADGPDIQAAARRALAAGVTVSDCFELIAGFRERHPAVPLGILTYANLVVAPGRKTFMRRAADAGADSLLVADVPAREAEPWAEDMREAGLAPVLIAAPNTPDDTLRTIARLSRGYTYCVSRAGITGTHQAGQFDAELVRKLDRFGAPPAVFGFGISTPDQVRSALAAGASGVICGSAIVDLISRQQSPADFVGTLKEATIEGTTRCRNELNRL